MAELCLGMSIVALYLTSIKNEFAYGVTPQRSAPRTGVVSPEKTWAAHLSDVR
jgi:hypothetical protein